MTRISDPDRTTCEHPGVDVGSAPFVVTSSDVLVADRYRLIRLCGRGAHGVVYEASDQRRAGLRVALKLLTAQHASALARLKNEFRSLAEVVHPNLVGLHALGADPLGWFVVMDLVDDATDFLRYVRPDGRCDEARLRGAVVQLVRGVAALHRVRQVHRDLKPSNVLVRPTGALSIVDFGLLGPADHAPAGFAGTPAYAAPEQTSRGIVGTPADLYAVGAMMFEALCGELPKSNAELPRLARAPADLGAVVSALLQQNPDARPSAEQVLRKLGELPTQQRPRRPCYVGRSAELRALWNAHLLEQPVLALISGPSGIGKTALLRRFAEISARGRGALVLKGRCHPHEQVPYKAFDALIEGLVQHLLSSTHAAVAMPRDIALTARLFPTLLQVPAVRAARECPEPEGGLLRRRAITAFKELLSSIAGRTPLLLCIDDLQWSDEDSLLLLEELVRGPGAPPCTIVCSARSDPAADVPQRSLRTSAKLNIALSPLRPEEARTLARSLLSEQLPRHAIERVIEEAAGSPFLLHELAHARGAFDLASALDARLSGIDPDEESLLAVACIAGHPLEVELALRAASASPAALLRLRARTLVDTFVEREREYVEGPHGRYRETVLARLPAPERRGLHARLADVLAHADADPARIAFHYQQAGRARDAVSHAVRAAERAFHALAFQRAAELFQSALQHAALEDRHRLSLALADCLANLGRMESAAEQYERAMAGAGPAVRRELASRAMMLYMLAGRFEQGARLLDAQCRELRVPHYPRPLALRTLAMLRARTRYLCAPRVGRLPEPRTSRHTARSKQALELYMRAARGFGPYSAEHGQYFALRSMISIREHRDPAYWPLALSWDVLWRSVMPGRTSPRDARTMSRALELAQAQADPELLSLVLAAEGSRCIGVGEHELGSMVFERAEQVLSAHGKSVASVYSGARSGRLVAWMMTGQLRDLRTHALDWLAEARALGDRVGEMVALVIGSYGLLAGGDAAAMEEGAALLATPLGRESLFRADPWWFGELALYRARAAEALEAYSRARASRGFRAVQRTAVHRVLTSLYHARARLLALEQGCAGDHLRHLERELRQLTKERYLPARAVGAHVRAGIAIARGREELARAYLLQAAGGYAAVGMRAHEAAMEFHAGILEGGHAGAQRAARALALGARLGLADPVHWNHTLLPGLRARARRRR